MGSRAGSLVSVGSAATQGAWFPRLRGLVSRRGKRVRGRPAREAVNGKGRY